VYCTIRVKGKEKLIDLGVLVEMGCGRGDGRELQEMMGRDEMHDIDVDIVGCMNADYDDGYVISPSF
jgi:hypothetical protein